MNEHAAKHAILNVTTTPEEAEEAVRYLATLDWTQEFRKQHERFLYSVTDQLHDIEENYKRGGGYCDGCDNLCSRVYAWPHPPGLYGQPNCDGWYCWKCFRRYQETIGAWEKEFFRCGICERILRWKVGYHITQRYKQETYGESVHFSAERSTLLCCLPCVEYAVTLQFCPCVVCGKKTTNGLSGATCYDCKEAFPKLQSIAGHLARARSAGTPATLTSEEWAATVSYFGEKCAYCRYRPIEVLEHFLPITLGGGTTADNCVPACFRCNSKKGNRHPDTLCYEVNLFRLPQDFSPEHIAHIRQYLSGEKPKASPMISTSRARVRTSAA